MMQNIDFYNGKNIRENPHQINRNDPEYFSRMSKFHYKEEARKKKHASRVIFVIAALCIISFTTGIVIGIKFAGGSNRKIVDEKTFKAVSGIRSKVTNIFNRNKNVEKFKSASFPKEEYPFVIKIGNGFSSNKSQKIADFLSNKGHTVILSRDRDQFQIFTGPYKNQKEAEIILKKFSVYSKNLLASNIKILKRK